MKLNKSMNNCFDYIFEKKESAAMDIKKSKEMSEEIVFYEKVLEKTKSFRNNWLEKPKSFLKSLVNKKINFPFIPLSLSIFSVIFMFSVGNPFINLKLEKCALPIVLIQVLSVMTLIYIVFGIYLFKKKQKQVIENISETNEVSDILKKSEDITAIITIDTLPSTFYKNKKEFERSLNSISNYKNLSENDVDLFLKSFNKEELSFIKSFLLNRFNKNTIEASVLDDLILFMEDKLTQIKEIEEIIIKEKEFKNFISEYEEVKEINNEQILKFLL